ncbi:Na channel amiloride sensitive [Fasciola hepatica]|uniref:Na channel amiloride sensitive n=1 Tax=Fasciola hepatica TaxID=6192 RepID=A0A4E0RB86_FASHE|nr:Na channel amiloride sensitive [Fasciola hepatica]
MKAFSSVFSQSSLVPLAKIANAPSRSLRLLWAVFTATMFVGLCACITLVVIQYCRHQTVFQLDYSGRNVIYDQIPGLTLCPQTQEAKRLFHLAVNMEVNKHPSPWLNKQALDKFRQIAKQHKPNMSFEVLTHRMPPGQLQWDTQKSALSPLYGMLHNFSVRFVMQPAQTGDSHRLTVMEQVPNPKHFLCTTFELRSQNPSVSRWSYLEMQLNQTATPPGSDMFSSFILITHERGELPFSAYDRHIQTSMTPGSDVSVYFSKSITARLNTARNPCHASPDMHLWQTGMESARVSEDIAVSATRQNSLVTDDESDPSSSTGKIKQEEEEEWELDFLDQLRMNHSVSEQPLEPQKAALKGSTVRLFGTTFFYSRESCGWAECSRKVRQVCNCSSVVELWSYKMHGCEAVEACERAECQVKQISYKTCPLACVVAKFVKHNTITETGSEVNLAPGAIQIKLVRSEAVQVATEEEIFSLAKLFSEVGGLCSLFIGFSCIFLFELVEAVILMYKDGKSIKKTNKKVRTLLSNSDNRAGNNLRQFQGVVTTEVVENPIVEHFLDTRSFGDLNGMTGESAVNQTSTNDRQSESSLDHGQIQDHVAGVGQTAPVMGDLRRLRQNQPVWEGGILIIPVCFAPGGVLTISDKSVHENKAINETENRVNGSNKFEAEAELTKEDLLQLLRQNRVRLRMC